MRPQQRTGLTTAALIVAEQDSDAVVRMMPADAATTHAEAMDRAMATARAGRTATFGMTPRSAETGYGYI